MKKVFICRVVDYTDVQNPVISNEISMVFNSIEKAENYCNWQNKDNEDNSIYWMQYKSYTICEHDFGTIK